MKFNIYHIIAAGVLAVGATACSDGWGPRTDQQGSVEFQSLSIDAVDASQTEKVVTANGRASLDLNDYIVTITDLSGAYKGQTWTYGNLPEIVSLPVGSYRVDVKSHEVAPAEWDRPLYSGSKEFKIEAGKITNVGVVTCNFASLKVSVVFDDALLEVCPDAKATIIVNDEGTLEFTPSETRQGYFEVVEGSTTLVSKFTGTVDGVYTEEHTPFTNIEAGQHHIITYRTKTGPTPPEQSGNIDPTQGIVLDTEITTVEIAGNVNVTEDNDTDQNRPWGEEPGEEDPVNPTPGPGDDTDKAATFVPSASSSNLKLAPATCTPSDDFGDAILDIDCPKGIAHLVVNISTDNDNFKNTLDQVGLPMTFDLAYTGDSREDIEGLNLPVDENVLNQTSVKFDITTFIGLLCPFKGTHTFTVTVTDNDNKAETAQLIFVAK